MKHITFADKSVLLGDEAADVLLEYAAALADADKADQVTLSAVSSDGDDVEATFLLSTGAPLMAESASTKLGEPDNTEEIAEMRHKIAMLGSHEIQPADPGEQVNQDDFDY